MNPPIFQYSQSKRTHAESVSFYWIFFLIFYLPSKECESLSVLKIMTSVSISLSSFSAYRYHLLGFNVSTILSVWLPISPHICLRHNLTLIITHCCTYKVTNIHYLTLSAICGQLFVRTSFFTAFVVDASPPSPSVRQQRLGFLPRQDHL